MFIRIAEQYAANGVPAETATKAKATSNVPSHEETSQMLAHWRAERDKLSGSDDCFREQMRRLREALKASRREDGGFQPDQENAIAVARKATQLERITA
jgi:hypothetical protein